MKTTLAKKIDAKESKCEELYCQRIKNLEIANSQLEARFEDLSLKYQILEKKLNKILSSNRINTGDKMFETGDITFEIGDKTSEKDGK